MNKDLSVIKPKCWNIKYIVFNQFQWVSKKNLYQKNRNYPYAIFRFVKQARKFGLTQNGDHSLKIVQACTANDPCVHTELFSHVILI